MKETIIIPQYDETDGQNDHVSAQQSIKQGQKLSNLHHYNYHLLGTHIEFYFLCMPMVSTGTYDAFYYLCCCLAAEP